MTSRMQNTMRIAMLMAAFTFIGCVAHADAFVWQGASGGAWNTAANWADGVVPNGSGVEVDFSAASGTYSVNVDVAVTVGKITLNGATAATLTLSGQKITFAGASTPEIYVGSGHTLLTTTTYGGTQGVKKTGGGTWKPTAQGNGTTFTGGLTVESGTAWIVKNGSGPWFAGGVVEAKEGGTLRFTDSDMMPSGTYSFKASGGTISYENLDHIGALYFSNGGKFLSKGKYVCVDDTATAHINATGDGDAGTFNGKLVAQSLWSMGKNLTVRTNVVNVANAGASFGMTGNIFANQAQAQTSDIYQKEFRDNKTYRAMIHKTGQGDLVFYDETVSLTDPTFVEAGRLVLSNTVKMAASAITLATGTSQLILREGATLQIGGINCSEDGTLDLGGNTVDIGGTADDGVFLGTFVNGKVRKVGCNTQQVGAPLPQADLDVMGGTLAVGGVPAPKVRYTFDDADNFGADSGTLGKTLAAEKEGAAIYNEGGISGGCASFNGTGCLLAATATGLPSGNAAFTISLWMKTTSTRANLSFTSWGNNTGNQYNGFLMQSSTQLKHTFWEGGVDFVSKSRASSLADGAWHHIALTYDPSAHTRTYYIDGVQFDSQMNAQYTRAVPEGNPFKVGFSQNSANFIGQMDEVMVFDRALTAAEVAAVKSWGDGAIATEAFASGGTVRLERDSTLSVSCASQTFTTISGKGTLALNNGAEAMVTGGSVGRVAGDGTLVKTGSGTLSLTAAKDLGATIDVQGGAVEATGPAVDDDLKSHLIAYWDFNDPDDPGKDASGNGVDLTSASTKSGSFTCEARNWRNRFETMGGAAYFSGVNTDYLVMADSANLSKLPSGKDPTYTVAMWIKPESSIWKNAGLYYWGGIPGGQYWGSQGNLGAKVAQGCRFTGSSSADGINFYFWSGGGTTYSLPSAGFFSSEMLEGWHHVVCTSGEKTRKLYVDGEPAGSPFSSGDMAIPAETFSLGFDPTQNGAGFKGYMDDVMIFDKVLTVDEVKAVMNGIADAPSGGSKVKLAANTSFAVAEGTVGLAGVTGEGGVSVPSGTTLVLAGGATELGGALTGAGTVAVTNGASLHLGGGQDFGGTVAVAADGTLDCRSGASSAVNALTLAEGAALSVTAGASAASPCVTATTAVALPVSANVTVSVPSSDGAKVEVLRSAAGLSGDVSGWTVEWNMPGRNWVGKLFVSGGSLWVEAHPRGTMISFR